MRRDLTATWHKASWDDFVNNRLPGLLSQQLPLAGYTAEPTGTFTTRITLAVGRGDAAAKVRFEDIPRPDETGVFELDGRRIVAVSYTHLTLPTN